MDISLHRSQQDLSSSIYQKLTFAETIIPCTSYHPAQHKYTAVRYLYEQVFTCHQNNDAEN